MSRYYVQMSGPAWLKTSALAEKHKVSVRQIVEAILDLPLERVDDGQLLRFVNRRPRALSIKEPYISQALPITKRLNLLSSGTSHERIGLVIEAYVMGYAESASPLVAGPGGLQGTLRDVRLSARALTGLREQAHTAGFTCHVAKWLTQEMSAGKTLTLTGRYVQTVGRRHPHRLILSEDVTRRLASEALRLGLDPEVSHGLVSWVSFVLESIGLGNVTIVGFQQKYLETQLELDTRELQTVSSS